MENSVVIILAEERDHRYSIIQEKDGNQKKVDICDLVTAESLALEAEELGIDVQWKYLEDVLAQVIRDV